MFQVLWAILIVAFLWVGYVVFKNQALDDTTVEEVSQKEAELYRDAEGFVGKKIPDAITGIFTGEKDKTVAKE